MFYAQDLLSKKTPMGQVWLAATLNKSLKRAQIFELDVRKVVADIMRPKDPLALRFSGQLLLGVVRVYERQVHFLFVDCNDALLKIKTATRPTTVDMSKPAAAAAVNVANFGAFDNDAQDEPDFELDMLFDVGDASNLVEVTLGLASQSQSPASVRGSVLGRSHGTPGTIELPRFAQEADARSSGLRRPSLSSQRLSGVMGDIAGHDEFAPAMDDQDVLRELEEAAASQGVPSDLGVDREPPAGFDDDLGAGLGGDLDLDLHVSGAGVAAGERASWASRASRRLGADEAAMPEEDGEQAGAGEQAEQADGAEDAAAQGVAAGGEDSGAGAAARAAMAELAALQHADEEDKRQGDADKRAADAQRRANKRQRKAVARDACTTLDAQEVRRLQDDPTPLLNPAKRLRARVRVTLVPLAAAFEQPVLFSALAPQLAGFISRALSGQPMPYPSLPADLRAEAARALGLAELEQPAAARADAGAELDAALDDAAPSKRRRSRARGADADDADEPVRGDQGDAPARAQDDDLDALAGGVGVLDDDLELPRDRDSVAGGAAVRPSAGRFSSPMPDRSAIAEAVEDEEVVDLPDVQLSYGGRGDEDVGLDMSALSTLSAPDATQASQLGLDRRLHRNTVRTVRTLSRALASRESVTFKQLTHSASRRDAARAFLQVLVLKTADCIDAQQEKPFAPISLSRAGRFDEHVAAAAIAV